MFRTALVIVAVICAGPAIGLVITWLGCAGANPMMGVFCGHNAYIPLLGFTFIGWVAVALFASSRSGSKL
jgi:hypothetical protein